MTTPARRCKGYKYNGKRCRAYLKGRQKHYCSRLCRALAKSKRRKKYYRDYYQRNKTHLNEQRRLQRAEERRLERIELERAAGMMKEREAKAQANQDDLEAAGIM